MNKKLLIVVGIIIAVVMFALLFLDKVHLAIAAVILLVDFIVVYSYTNMKDRDIPEELHDSYEGAFAVEEIDESNENFLENKTKICLVCNTENNIHRKYCKRCNTLIQNITCPVCETKNPHTAKYCSHCDSILQNKTRS